jgi:hypothetical protein
MMPTTCTFSPWVEVVATANRKIAPSAISVIPAPVLMTRRPPAGWTGLFIAHKSEEVPCDGSHNRLLSQ